MSVFVTMALGRFFSGPVLRRSWLGIGGVGTVAAAGLAAYGVNSSFGDAEFLFDNCLIDESFCMYLCIILNVVMFALVWLFDRSKGGKVYGVFLPN